MARWTWSFRFGLMLLVISTAFCGLALGEESAVIHIEPGDSIQTAINSAAEGAVILLADGVYEENLEIRTSIAIRGNLQTPSAVVIQASDLGPTVTVSGDEISTTIEGISLSGAHGFSAHGIAVYGSANLSLTRVIVQECKEDGVSIHSGGRVHLRECRIVENRRFGVAVYQQAAQVAGDANEFSGNGADLGFYAPASLRQPLVAVSENQTVRVPEDYATVQEAIDAVAPHGTVTIGAGQYAEGLTLWKPVTLRGQDAEKTTLRPTAGRIVGGSVLCDVETVTIEGMKLVDGWWLAGRQHALRDLHVGSRSGTGLVLAENARGVFEALLVSSVGGPGLLVKGHAVADLRNCTFAGNITGIRVEGQGFVDVEACRFEENRVVGLVFLGESELNVIRSSSFTRSHMGILQQYDGSVLVEHCVFEDSKLSGIYGETGTIELDSCAFRGSDVSAIRAKGGRVSGSRCVISGTQEVAVLAGQAGRVTLTDCVITENDGLGFSAGGTSQSYLVRCEISLNGLEGSNGSDSSGVLVADDATVTLEDCSIERNAGYGIDVILWTEAARLDPSVSGNEPPKNELTLSGCRISENYLTGLRILHARRVVVSETQFLDGYGGGVTIETDCPGGIEFVDCEFADNLAVGLAIDSASEIRIDRCAFLRNSNMGLFIRGTPVVSVNESYFAGHSVGLGLVESPVVSLTDCEFTGNPGYGVLVYGLACSGGAHLHQAVLDFIGELTGSGNWIPGPSGLNGNGLGGICPEGEWEFLLLEDPGMNEGQSG